MDFYLIPVVLNILLILMYWVARNRQNLKLTAIVQPLTTLLSIIVAVISFFNPQVNHTYVIWILVGLGLSFLADIFNIDMNNDKIFYAGIAVFILAYLEYAVTFTVFNQGFHRQDIIVGIVFLLLYVLLMRLLWKGLGKYKLPVLIYGLIMPFMVTRAISTLSGGSFPTTAAVLVTAGSLMLYLGDVEYGLQRFYKPGKFTIGPICYAGGQLLIALSCAFFIL